MKRLMDRLFGSGKPAKRDDSLAETLKRMYGGRGTFVVMPLPEIRDPDGRDCPAAPRIVREASAEEAAQLMRLLERLDRESRAGNVAGLPGSRRRAGGL